MSVIYNPEIFRNRLKRHLAMTYGANNYLQFYGIIMSLVRLIQSQYYSQFGVVIWESRAFRLLCADPNVFRIFNGVF